MSIREKLEILRDELVYLKRTGLEQVSISEETLALLQSLAPTEVDPISTSVQEKRIPAPSPLAVAAATTTPPRTPPKVVTHESKLLPPSPVIELPAGDKQTQSDFLRAKVLSCPTSQKQLNPGKQLVYGVGNLDADIFFCGEAPGADEETQGVPFVGEAGELLTKMIQAMGVKREQVYIANIMTWRPQTGKAFGNRPPTEDEMRFCLPYLQAQIDIVQPKVLVALGGTAVNGLLGFDKSRRMAQVRGKWHRYTDTDTDMMITFHPTYLLHNNSLRTKRMVWEDLLQVMEKVNLPISDKQRGYFLPKAS